MTKSKEIKINREIAQGQGQEINKKRMKEKMTNKNKDPKSLNILVK